MTGIAIVFASTLFGTTHAPTLGHLQDERSHATGRFALRLDGESGVSYLNRFKGGRIKNQDITMEVSPGAMSREFYKWIKESFSGNEKRSGAFVSADFDYKVQSTVEFEDAIITGISVPTLDGDARDPGFISVQFQPESTRERKGDGETITKPSKRDQNLWSPANFRLEVEGLDCRRVSKLDLPDLMAKIPSRGSNVKMTIPEEDVRKWPVKWSGPDLDADKIDFKARRGRLYILDDRLREIMSIDFRMLKVIRVKRPIGSKGKSVSMDLLFDSFKMQ